MESLSSLGYFHKLLRKRRLIAWGAGNFFKSFHAQWPLNIECIIDSNANKESVCGLPIRSPHYLLNEDPKRVLVLVYSIFSKQIREKVQQIGPFDVVSASEVMGFPQRMKMEKELDCAQRFFRKPLARRHAAILVQGPFISRVTDRILRYLATHFSDYHICFSTWNDTDCVGRVEPFVDSLIFNTRPVSGYQNRNLQIVSTRNGLKHLHKKGITHCLKLRSDLFTQSPTLMEDCLSVLAEHTPSSYLKSRIVIPETYTRKYLFYHPSDIAMFGHIEDLMKFWDVPLDKRQMTPELFDDPDLPLEAIGRAQTPTETYLGCEFAKNIGWDLQFTHSDNWNFFRKLFVIRSQSFFQLQWLKYPLLPPTRTAFKYQECISEKFWERLYSGYTPKIPEPLSFKEYSETLQV